MAQTPDNARKRNWQKARLVSFSLDKETLTVKEQELYIKMVRLKNELLETWDMNSAILSGTTLPTYKCWCGKRTNVERLSKYEAQLGGPQYLCLKHFTEEQDASTD